jgi:hypothetical protein
MGMRYLTNNFEITMQTGWTHAGILSDNSVIDFRTFLAFRNKYQIKNTNK